MDGTIRERALEEAVDLTRAALSSSAGNACAVAHPDDAVEFLDATYRKLCELWDEAVTDD